jgi:hypothetical protein
MKKGFNFFKTEMPDSRKADFHLGCLDDSVFIDFNRTDEGLVTLCRISFDGYGCCNIICPMHLLNFELSKKFIEEIEKDEIDQNELTPIVKEIIKINQDYIWKDALEKYNLIDKHKYE